MPIVAKFSRRGGGYHHGIPARPLTDEDWALLTREQRNAVRRSPLYLVDDAHAAPEIEPEPVAPAPAPAPPAGPTDAETFDDQPTLATAGQEVTDGR